MERTESVAAFLGRHGEYGRDRGGGMVGIAVIIGIIVVARQIIGIVGGSTRPPWCHVSVSMCMCIASREKTFPECRGRR